MWLKYRNVQYLQLKNKYLKIRRVRSTLCIYAYDITNTTKETEWSLTIGTLKLWNKLPKPPLKLWNEPKPPLEKDKPIIKAVCQFNGGDKPELTRQKKPNCTAEGKGKGKDNVYVLAFIQPR